MQQENQGHKSAFWLQASFVPNTWTIKCWNSLDKYRRGRNWKLIPKVTFRYLASDKLWSSQLPRTHCIWQEALPNQKLQLEEILRIQMNFPKASRI